MRKIIKPQQIAMLEYLGVPYRKQPKPTAEKTYLLQKYETLDAVKYTEAYSIIVNHRIPDSLVSDGKAIEAHKVAELVQGAWEGEEAKITLGANEQIRTAVKKLTASYDSMMADVRQGSLKVAEEAITEASKKFITHQVKVGNKKPVKVNGVLPEYFDKLLQLAQQRVNILLVGPAGCGKTHTAALLAQALGLPFASQSCSGGVSESVFIGWLLPTGNNGKFTHNASAFLNMYENGGVFLLDEMDRADPNVMVFLNQALAQDEFYLPQRFDNPKVKKHKDFVAIGAANTFGGGADGIYHSANALDGSTLDRFRIGTIAVEYSAAVETELVDPEILTWGLKVRSVIANHNLRRIMSTRVMLDASNMKRNQEWTLDDVANSYFGDWSQEEKLLVSRSDLGG